MIDLGEGSRDVNLRCTPDNSQLHPDKLSTEEEHDLAMLYLPAVLSAPGGLPGLRTPDANANGPYLEDLPIPFRAFSLVD